MSVARLFRNPIALVLLLPLSAFADAPGFDRPGFAFASSTLPAGSWDMEQGLPDLQRDASGGMHTTLYSADTTFRLGLTQTLEIQLAGSAFNRLDVRTAGATTHSDGAGDTGIAMKWAPALADRQLSLAILGGVTLDSGAGAFTNGRPVYALGATLGRDLGGGKSLSLYANLNRSGAANTWTLAPSFNFAVNEQIGAFVEAGRVAGGGNSSTLVGGGLTWLLRERVQLDLYERRGVTSHSPDEQAGFGISIYWN